jgi:hypothetical protein
MKSSAVIKAASLLSSLCKSAISAIRTEYGKLIHQVASVALAQDKFTHAGTGIEFW